MVACMIMALCGYLTFGDKTQGNVLNNFSADNIIVNVARLYALLHSSLSRLRLIACLQLLWSQYAYNFAARMLRVPRGHDTLLLSS